MDARALSQVTVLDVHGSAVRLGELWQANPAVTVWLRHYGCVFCREQALEMRGALPEIEKAGARLVFIGNGGPRYAKAFKDSFAPDVTVLTDPDLRSYRTIGARSGILKTIGPQAWKAGIRALRSGARQTSVKGHPYQQGAVMVLTPGDHVVYSYISRAAGDHPSVSSVLAALRASTPRAAAGF
jgi:peroxiredoxin